MDTTGSRSEGEREFGEFVIDAHTPDSIPMGRLAEYMAVLFELLGKNSSVHFEKIEEGSLKIRYWTSRDHLGEVTERPSMLAAGLADKPTLGAYSRMNDLLEADHSVGTFELSGIVIPFPGRDRVHSPVYGPIEEELAVEGQLVRIGGKDKSIHASIQDGNLFYNCEMSRSLAMEMCHFLFGPEIRVFGRARFQRDRDGDWKQLLFSAQRFEELDDAPLTRVVQKLRAIEGNAWKHARAPLAELALLRSED